MRFGEALLVVAVLISTPSFGLGQTKYYGAIAFSASTQKFGVSGGEASEAEARRIALRNCNAADAKVMTGVVTDGLWLALAICVDGDGFAVEWAGSRAEAEVKADRQLKLHGHKQSRIHAVTSGYGPVASQPRQLDTPPPTPQKAALPRQRSEPERLILHGLFLMQESEYDNALQVLISASAKVQDIRNDNAELAERLTILVHHLRSICISMINAKEAVFVSR